MKRTIKIALLLLMLAGVLVTMTACGKTKIDVTEGLYVSFSGADGSGQAEICFDKMDPADKTPAFLYTLMESNKIAANDWQTLMTLGSAITYDLEPSTRLSNGDTVTVTVTVNQPVLESLKLKAEPAKLTFKVEGLTEVKAIQPFQNFEIVFAGVSPDAYIDHFTMSEEIDGTTVGYRIEENSPYQAGQELTVKATLGDTTNYKLTEDTMTVTVTGVDKYLGDISELQSGTLDAMRGKADAIVAEQIRNWEGYYSYDGYEFVGYEFWSRHEDVHMGKVNAVYLYYKINANDSGSPFTTYYYVSFEDVLQRQDGTQEVNVEKYFRPTIGLYAQLKEYPTLESRTNEAKAMLGYDFDVQQNFQ